MLDLFLRGFGILPPPTNETPDTVWCGALNGLVEISGTSCFNIPAMLWIFVISSASSKLKSGNIVGSLLASIVFPDPGDPINKQLWPPAAAISRARFMFSCPFTSEKSKISASLLWNNFFKSNFVLSICIL